MSTRKIVLAIDAGHGYGNARSGVYDPGAEGGGLSEADIALAWAETLKWEAVSRGVAVHMIRTGKTDANPVGGRDNEAVAAGATHMISIHCNAADSTAATGVETFYRDATDKPFAVAAHAGLLTATKLKDRGLKTEAQSQHPRLAVLDFPGPNCLVEAGFITNPTDRARLLSRDVRIAFADAVIDFLAGPD